MAARAIDRTGTADAALAALVEALGRPGFAERLLAAAGGRIAHDAAALMVFDPVRPPAVAVDRLKAGERAYLYGDYVSGVYRLSPFYRAAADLNGPRVARVMDIAPEGFAHSEYHRRYFGRIGVADMIGVLLPLAGGRTAFLSYSRSSGRRRFSPADVAAVGAVLAVLQAAARRHEELTGILSGRRVPHLPAATPGAAPAAAGLTGREREVAELILEGHSTRALAAKLAISVETVRVHRRHIYAKLGVTSQAELFRWYLAGRGA